MLPEIVSNIIVWLCAVILLVVGVAIARKLFMMLQSITDTVEQADDNQLMLNGEQLNDEQGLVGTHAYSILDARELGLIPGLTLGAGVLGQTRLIKLRNPWGSYEWKGAWSDGSKEWKENPLVKMRLRPKDEDDGTFWMPWDQFVAAGFNKIDICDRTTKNDLRLSAEDRAIHCSFLFGGDCGLTLLRTYSKFTGAGNARTG